MRALGMVHARRNWPMPPEDSARRSRVPGPGRWSVDHACG